MHLVHLAANPVRAADLRRTSGRQRILVAARISSSGRRSRRIPAVQQDTAL